MKAIKLLQELKDLKLRRWGNNEYTKALNSGGGGIYTDDLVMRIISIVKEGSYVSASKGHHFSPEDWEEFVDGIPDNTEFVGQYSEDTSNVVYFVFPGETESEDDAHVTVFLLSDDDYALVPTTVESDDEEEDSTRYLNDWINNATEGEYTSAEDVPTVTSQGYHEGYALGRANQYNTNDGVFFTLKDRNFNYILGYNATWQETAS